MTNYELIRWLVKKAAILKIEKLQYPMTMQNDPSLKRICRPPCLIFKI